jgi:hypothetical protein
MPGRTCCFTLLLAAVTALPAAAGDKLPDYRPVPGWPKVPDDVTLGPVSAVAADSSDRVYVLHRGKRPVLVFDSDRKAGRIITAGTAEGAVGRETGRSPVPVRPHGPAGVSFRR